MHIRFHNYIKIVVAAFLLVSFCLVEADAQTRRKRRTRRATRPAVERPVITNPPIAAPEGTQTTNAGDVKIISTADGAEPNQSSETKKAKTEADTSEQENTKQTMNALSNQVNQLNDKLKQMNENDRYQLDMERLTRAEQRAEQLRSQLMEVQTKIADFESKLEQIDWALKPENIEASTAGYGSTRPEAARDARRKQLEGEKSRVTAQLKLAETSRTRLEVAVANADSEVDLLRAKLQQRREQMDATPPAESTPPKPRKPE